jgi:hypothetical protein
MIFSEKKYNLRPHLIVGFFISIFFKNLNIMGQKIKVIEPTSEVSFIITKQFEVETENGDQYLCQIVDSNKFGEQEFLYKPKGADDYEGSWGQDNEYPEDVQELGEKLLENFWNGYFDEEGEFDLNELEN